jgi:hypothetical protein
MLFKANADIIFEPQVGDTLDVKLLEINERGQLRLSHRALLVENEKGASPGAGPPGGSSGSEPAKPAFKAVWQRPGNSTGGENALVGNQVSLAIRYSE